MEALVRLLKALADESRLRIVRLLMLARELNVGELVSVLGIAQSSVSQKLAELRRAGLVAERREGGYSYYELVAAPGLELLRAELERSPDAHGDEARLKELLRERAERGEAAGRYLEPGRSWVAWARALGHLIPRLEVADFGCGDGALTCEIASWAASVVAIERDRARLAQARARARKAALRNVRFLGEDLETLSLPAASVDLVVVSHALHFTAEPLLVLQQAARVLRPTGRVLVLELASHAELWVREKLGHLHLGFSAAELKRYLEKAGFEAAGVESVAGKAAREPFRVWIATGVRS